MNYFIYIIVIISVFLAFFGARWVFINKLYPVFMQQYYEEQKEKINEVKK